MLSGVSSEILKAFQPLDYTLEMMNYSELYKKINNVLPLNKTRFDDFDDDVLIGCEVVCAAICHKINWDTLRHSVYQYTKRFPYWLKASSLANFTDVETEQLLGEYELSKIKVSERKMMIQQVGQFLLKHYWTFKDIFYVHGVLKPCNRVVAELQEMPVFAMDVMQKKLRLLIQALSDYKEFEQFQSFLEPTIDYHIMRLFLRRGIVRFVNQAGRDFIFKNKIRKEQTVAALRKICEDSLLDLCWITEMSVKDINRIEWWMGRSICVRGRPDCSLEGGDSSWLKHAFDKCPYAVTCYARNNHMELLLVDEPEYTGTNY